MRNFTAHSKENRTQMLKEIGVSSIDELFEKIPQAARVNKLNLPDAISEMEAQKELRRLASKNRINYISFIGGGAEKHFVPACVSQIAQRFEFNTAYTPYQPEISQGTLQMIYEYQSMICNLCGMDVANASVFTVSKETLLFEISFPLKILRTALLKERIYVLLKNQWCNHQQSQSIRSDWFCCYYPNGPNSSLV